MKTMFKTTLALTAAIALSATSAATFAAGHSPLAVEGENQSMTGGTVTASKITAGENGWLVVHKTDGMKPGPVIGHAPLKAGDNTDVTAILTEAVAAGDKVMLMLHSEQGGSETGIFEYTLGAKEDGPVKVDGKLVMQVVEAK